MSDTRQCAAPPGCGHTWRDYRKRGARCHDARHDHARKARDEYHDRMSRRHESDAA